MIDIDTLRELAKYGQLYAIRQSDGKKVAATRTVPPGQAPVLWEIDEMAEQSPDYTKMSFWTAPVSELKRAYATSELVQEAQRGVYSEWQPGPGCVADIVDYPVH
jgi:hypothetical protein